MTLAVAFVRRLPERENREELVFAADTRLSFGQRLDHGPKIFSLPRSDALFAFAGDTMYAYPLALQLQTAIEMYPRSTDRRFPLPRARGHLLRVFDQVYRAIHSFPFGVEEPLPATPPVQFLFGGYVWHDEAFRIWYIDLDSGSGFRFRKGGRWFFIGDDEPVAEARSRTSRLLADRNRTAEAIDLEPLEVLRDIVLEGRHSSVGGGVQVAKVYRYLDAQFFATSGATHHAPMSSAGPYSATKPAAGRSSIPTVLTSQRT